MDPGVYLCWVDGAEGDSALSFEIQVVEAAVGLDSDLTMIGAGLGHWAMQEVEVVGLDFDLTMMGAGVGDLAMHFEMLGEAGDPGLYLDWADRVEGDSTLRFEK